MSNHCVEQGKPGTDRPKTSMLKSAAIPLQILQPAQMKAIDQALSTLGDWGEVRIIVANGKVRYIEKLRIKRKLSLG